MASDKAAVERIDLFQNTAYASADAALDESVDLRLRRYYAGIALHYDAIAGRERRALEVERNRARLRASLQADSGSPG